MAKLTLKDGRTISFPDGLSPDQVSKIVAAASEATPSTSQQPKYEAPEGMPAPSADYWGTRDQALDFASMGLLNKGGAAMNGLLDATVGAIQGEGWNYSDNYEKWLNWQRENQRLYNEQNPIRSGIGTAAGVALGITQMPTIGRGLLGAAGTGSAYGAIAGAGQDAGSLFERAGNALLGAGTGGVIGGVGYGLGGLAAKWLTKAGEVVSSMRAPPEARALAQIYQAGDEVAGPYNAMSLSRRLNDLGPDAINADVLGKRGAALGRGAANISPDARETLEGVVQARKAGQNVRLATDIETASGLPIGNTKNVDALKKEAFDAVSPEINRAYSTMREAGYDLPLAPYDDILNTPMGRSAKAKALQAVRNRNFDSPVRGDGVQPSPRKVRSTSSVANRAVRQMGPMLGPRPRKPTDLLDYIKGKGGVRDFKGELRSLDAKQARGLVKEGGISLDQARELAAREGYLDYKFGNADRAVSESTVADFLDAIDENLRGNPIFATADGYEADLWRMYKDAQASRAQIWETAKRVADEAGGSPINDDVLRDAVARVIERGDDPVVALEGALYDDFLKFGAEPQAVPGGIFEKTERNYSNAAYLDEIKRALDDVAGSAGRAGLKNKAAQASALSKALRQRMDGQMQADEYAVARGLRRKAFQADEAFDLGAELGGSRVGLGLPQRVAQVEPGLLGNVARGYGATKVESLLNKGSTEGALNELLRPQSRAASKAALGKRDAIVERGLSREKTFNTTNRELLGNSSTARQLAEMAGTGIGTTTVGMLLGYDPTTSGIAGGLAALGRRAVPTITKRLVSENQKAVAPYIANILAQHGMPVNKPLPPQELARFLEKVATAGDAKLAKTLALIWNNEVQKTSPQMAPAR